MAPFRWPLARHDIMLAREVAGKNPNHNEWTPIANILSKEFSTTDKAVEISGRACRERMERLLKKFHDDDKKALKKSGTEEEYNELQQLLHDIFTFRRDRQELEKREKLEKKRKETQEKKKGEEMRAAAMAGIGKRKSTDASESEASSGSESDGDDSSSMESAVSTSKKKKACPSKPATKCKKRASKLSAIEMLEKKNEKKASLKEMELEQRRKEFEFQKQRYEDEALERKEKLQLELEERRMFLSLLKDKF